MKVKELKHVGFTCKKVFRKPIFSSDDDYMTIAKKDKEFRQALRKLGISYTSGKNSFGESVLEFKAGFKQLAELMELVDLNLEESVMYIH